MPPRQIDEPPCPVEAPCPILFAFFAKRLGTALVPLHRLRQHIPPQAGNPVVNRAPHLSRERQHGAQYLAKRRQIVLRRPRAQFQQVLAEQRLLIEHGLEIPHLKIRRSFGLKRRHHADQLLIAEGHNHPRSALR